MHIKVVTKYHDFNRAHSAFDSDPTLRFTGLGFDSLNVCCVDILSNKVNLHS